MEYHISYPSGTKLKLRGQFKKIVDLVPGSKIPTPAIVHNEVDVTILDPRAIIFDDLGNVVYVGCSTKELEDDMKDRSVK